MTPAGNRPPQYPVPNPPWIPGLSATELQALAWQQAERERRNFWRGFRWGALAVVALVWALRYLGMWGVL